jgi:hypothetical protein
VEWRPAVLAFGAGLLAVSVGLASAATLGVIDPKSLGTSSTVIAACDSSLGISWDDPSSPTYAGSGTAANSTFNVTRMLLTGVDNTCNGQKYRLAIADSSGAALVSQSGTVAVTGGTVTFTFAATNSKNIEQVTITIYQ